jgi:glycosidase
MASDRWWQQAVIYQVYPRSFMDSNGDGIGDLPGVIERLAHLVDLGVDAVWLSPFFASPQRDIGYDVSDYRSVAPEYGTIDDAQRLIDRCHQLGLKVVFDLVLNHTSDQHPWFVESRSSRDNPKADWYVWADGGTGPTGRPTPPNNWRSELVVPRAWQWSEERQQWYLATFLAFQPDLNWHNPDVEAEMTDMIRMWLDRGVDGFRLDIFHTIMHDAALRSNRLRPQFRSGLPRLDDPIHTLNTDENYALAQRLRAVCDGYDGDRALLGEVFGTPGELRRYVEDDGRPGLNLVFLFDFLVAPYDAGRLRSLIARFEGEYPAPHVPTYVLENHDRERSMTRLGGDERKARVMATLLCTLRGTSVLFQGQEIGMTNRPIALRDANDPVPHVVAPWMPEWVHSRLPERLNRDEVRVPMQWSAEEGAGFTDPGVPTWLPIDDDHVRVNVEAQAEDPRSLLSWYRELLVLRRSSTALRSGSLELFDTDPDVLAFERHEDGERFATVANLGERTVRHPVNGAEVAATSDPRVVLRASSLSLPPHTAVVLRLR